MRVRSTRCGIRRSSAITALPGARRSPMLATSGSSMLADMLLVDGDPLQDVTILTDRRRMAMVMKDGDISTIRPALQVVR